MNISELSYEDRQLITVQSQEDVDDLRSAEGQLRGSSGPNQRDWRDLAKRMLTMASPSVSLVAAAYELWAETRQRAQPPLLVLGRNEVSSIDFPLGHPRNDHVYIGHPAKPDVYFLASSFHRSNFELKFFEAVELLSALGAHSLEVTSSEGWEDLMAAKVSAPAGLQAGSAGVEASQKRSGNRRIFYKAELAGRGEPSLHTEQVWYPHEPTWQLAARQRLGYGATRLQLSVSYRGDFGVTAGLMATIEKSGFNIGGNFEEHRETVWDLLCEFPAPHQEGALAPKI